MWTVDMSLEELEMDDGVVAVGDKGKRRKKLRSKVWSFFKMLLIGPDEKLKCKCKCKKCGNIYLSDSAQGTGPTSVTASISDLKPGLHGFHVHALGAASISHLKPGLHGFHVHALGGTTNGCMSASMLVSLEFLYMGW